MQHDDDHDDDNATAREIIKEIRARKHKGDIRENDHYQPGKSGVPRGFCPQTDSGSYCPCFDLPKICRALSRDDDEQGGHTGNFVHLRYQRSRNVHVENLLQVANPLLYRFANLTHNTAALVSNFWSFRTYEAPSQTSTALSDCTAIRTRCGQNDTAAS